MPAQQQIVKIPVPQILSGVSQSFTPKGLRIADCASKVAVHVVQCNVVCCDA